MVAPLGGRGRGGGRIPIWTTTMAGNAFDKIDKVSVDLRPNLILKG